MQLEKETQVHCYIITQKWVFTPASLGHRKQAQGNHILFLQFSSTTRVWSSFCRFLTWFFLGWLEDIYADLEMIWRGGIRGGIFRISISLSSCSSSLVTTNIKKIFSLLCKLGFHWIAELVSTALGEEHGFDETFYVRLFLDLVNLFAVRSYICLIINFWSLFLHPGSSDLLGLDL